MDCPMWPIPDRVLDAVRENPELLEDDDWYQKFYKRLEKENLTELKLQAY